ncbi:acyl-CoA carboxylase epsilon subunit [Cellulomonas cellasea]|uniref:acyl-CoA carboxylase epsilon subunit n=1 Tax=Cellulomonas cellasea TaxID=43670 RepID=UPI0025A39CC8|nr:acyl-CoA carboxylase epsilon subunit [Cellulomonas cellasea]MDM8086164.1 acyl-CoA carboxylase epsilon subunit [Cellulomonas cellasea]
MSTALPNGPTSVLPGAPIVPAAPHVHVVRGEPDEAELAALVAGLAAARSQDAHESHPGDDGLPVSAWADRSRTLRGAGRAPAPGPDGWRWSLHP